MKHAEFRLEKLAAEPMSFDLFEHEESGYRPRPCAVEAAELDAEALRADFAELLKDYERLFKTTRRLVRLSDRNEAELSAMAEKHRQLPRK